MFMYCEKCAYIANMKHETALCPACETTMKPVPREYLTESGFMFSSNSAKAEFEADIRQSLNYSRDADVAREKILLEKENRRACEINRKVNEYNNTRPKLICPVCKCENLAKISNVGKLVKVQVFGIIGAGDIGKTYKCNSCGYRF